MNTENVYCSAGERASFIKKRISEKIEDYDKYAFTQNQDCALKTFFDLAQEFDDQRDFYTICVLIPKVFYQLECQLFLVNEKGNFDMVCHTHHSLRDGSEKRNDSFRFLIQGNMELLSSLPYLSHNGLLGMLEIHPDSKLTAHMKLFLEKYHETVLVHVLQFYLCVLQCRPKVISYEALVNKLVVSYAPLGLKPKPFPPNPTKIPQRTQ